MPDLDRSDDVDNLVVGNYEFSALVSVAPYTKTHNDNFEIEEGDFVYQISVFINCLGPQDESGFDGVLRSKFHYTLQRAYEEMKSVGWFTIMDWDDDQNSLVPTHVEIAGVVDRAVSRFEKVIGKTSLFSIPVIPVDSEIDKRVEEMARRAQGKNFSRLSEET